MAVITLKCIQLLYYISETFTLYTIIPPISFKEEKKKEQNTLLSVERQ